MTSPSLAAAVQTMVRARVFSGMKVTIMMKDIRTGFTESGFLYGGSIGTVIAPGCFVRAEYSRVNCRQPGHR